MKKKRIKTSASSSRVASIANGAQHASVAWSKGNKG
jgi:hypothetical protein